MYSFSIWFENYNKQIGCVDNIEEITIKNNNFRKVIYTAKNCQLVIMSLNPNEDIGEEIHDVDQFIRIEKGNGKAILNDKTFEIKDNFFVLIPAGIKHNIINNGKEKMKLYSIYSPPHHKKGTIHKTKKESLQDKEHFNGKTDV